MLLCKMAKILVVDDSEISRDVIRSLLTEEGHEILTARDGEEGLETALRENPNLIITDHNMPRMSGLDLCRRLSEQRKDIKLIWTSAMSEYEAREYDLAYKATGASAFLSKPYMDFDEIHRKIKKVLGGN